MQALFWSLLFASPAAAADIVVFGDSWAEGSADELAEVLWDNGLGNLTVDPRGVGGTTAEYWAQTDPGALPAAVTANPDARWVWLSIGGNDLFAHHYAGNGGQTAADNDAHIRVILDALFAAHPDVDVVMFGYDFVNFEQSYECVATAFQYFGDTITTPQVNAYFLEQVADVQDAIAEDYPHVTYVDSVWGTLQRAGGVPNAPDAGLPSPAAFFSDCIHPNHAGYVLVHQALFDAYWGVDPPQARIEVDPAEPFVGDLVSITSASTGAERLRWTVDGAEAGTGSQTSFEAQAPGTLTVTLRADAGAWHDEATVQIGITAQGDDPRTPPDGDDVGAAGCGCTHGTMARWALVLPLALVRRRR